MTSEFAVIEEDWMPGNICSLKPRSHFARVERIAVAIGISGDNHCRRIGHALLHILIWRVPGKNGKVVWIVGSAELLLPNVRVIKNVIAQHVQYEDSYSAETLVFADNLRSSKVSRKQWIVGELDVIP